jgi:hypothetical protein
VNWIVSHYCDLPDERCAVVYPDAHWIRTGPDSTEEGEAADLEAAKRAALGDTPGAPAWGRMAVAVLSGDLAILAIERTDGSAVPWQIRTRSGVADSGTAETLEAAQAAADKAFRGQLILVPWDLMPPPGSPKRERRARRRPQRRGRR